MTRSHKVLGFLFVAILGIYGCAQAPSSPPDNRSAAAEAKVQRLEEDFKAAAAARDSFRLRLLAAEERQVQLQREVDQATGAAAQERSEKEAARAELKARTAERDNLAVQYDVFRKSIRELLGQAESALNAPAGGGPAFVGTHGTTCAVDGRN
jgi:membrane protein involved in colicin uptake